MYGVFAATASSITSLLTQLNAFEKSRSLRAAWTAAFTRLWLWHRAAVAEAPDFFSRSRDCWRTSSVAQRDRSESSVFLRQRYDPSSENDLHQSRNYTSYSNARCVLTIFTRPLYNSTTTPSPGARNSSPRETPKMGGPPRGRDLTNDAKRLSTFVPSVVYDPVLDQMPDSTSFTIVLRQKWST